MAYIEEEITDLTCSLNTLWERLNKLENRVSTLEDIAETNGEKMDEFVRIVRCKECKWYANDIELYDRCRNEDGMFSPRDDDYCSEGERMMDEVKE